MVSRQPIPSTGEVCLGSPRALSRSERDTLSQPSDSRSKKCPDTALAIRRLNKSSLATTCNPAHQRIQLGGAPDPAWRSTGSSLAAGLMTSLTDGLAASNPAFSKGSPRLGVQRIRLGGQRIRLGGNGSDLAATDPAYHLLTNLHFAAFRSAFAPLPT